MNQQPTNIPAGLAQGGRGLVLVIFSIIKLIYPATNLVEFYIIVIFCEKR
jgi:hypothetical protein